MTGLEIAAIVEAGTQLTIKILELVISAQQGSVEAAEALKRITESTTRNDASTAELNDYLDKKFDAT